MLTKGDVITKMPGAPPPSGSRILCWAAAAVAVLAVAVLAVVVVQASESGVPPWWGAIVLVAGEPLEHARPLGIHGTRTGLRDRQP